MLEITNLVTPSPEMFKVVIKGMRLPFKSGDKSDSGIEYKGIDGELVEPEFKLGEKDKKLLLNLCKAGDPSHRKVLRQLPVLLEIKAPLYFFKQLDTYKVSTVAQSESTMHTLVKKEFEMSDFSLEFSSNNHSGIPDFEFVEMFLTDSYSLTLGQCFRNYLSVLNNLREEYLETKDIRFWHLINKLLPQSYNQTRCWSGNYETLVNIVNQRSGHKLGEWKTFIDYMLENVPYLKEIIEAINGTR